ncbi:MAG: hypothetical protein DMF61_08235 [Blastocatellia bacterium AA13]|nr:MAG: hypothetical protein DMF61_08235 [Blastocatellia bacterium AA13]
MIDNWAMPVSTCTSGIHTHPDSSHVRIQSTIQIRFKLIEYRIEFIGTRYSSNIRFEHQTRDSNVEHPTIQSHSTSEFNPNPRIQKTKIPIIISSQSRRDESRRDG